MNADLIIALQDCYRAQCDGDWERQQGITIGTLDNPGWSVEIAVEGAPLERVACQAALAARITSGLK